MWRGLFIAGILWVGGCTSAGTGALRDDRVSPLRDRANPAACIIDAECPKGQRCESRGEPRQSTTQGICVVDVGAPSRS